MFVIVAAVPFIVICAVLSFVVPVRVRVFVFTLPPLVGDVMVIEGGVVSR